MSLINGIEPETTPVHLERTPQSAHVLIAEPDGIYRKILQCYLLQWGYQVSVAEDGIQTWEMLQKQPSPELLILSWDIAGIDGVEICQRIRQSGSGPYRYILLVTSQDRKEDTVRGLEAGADDYFAKPFDKHEIQHRLAVGQRFVALRQSLEDMQKQLVLQASRDPLTGAWHRTEILDRFGRELERAERSSAMVGILMLDLDHFKNINNTYGHQTGDTILKEVTANVTGMLRPYDSIGRYHGEEFLIVLPDCDLENARDCAERIRSLLARTSFSAPQKKIRVTVTIGVTVAGPGCSASTALALADSAVYKGKRQGRNRVTVCSPE